MSVRTEPSILWREGLFLCPQHMQSQAREVQARIHAAEEMGSPGSYGLLAMEVDEETLTRDAFRLLSASVVFPDGTLASFPENATVAQREFGALFEGPHLNVYLGIPARRIGLPEIGEAGNGSARFAVRVVEIYDENLESEPRDMEVRILQGRLFFGDEDRSGFECAPLARLVRKGKPEAVSALSESYIPPVLACGGSAVLVRRLQEMAAAVRAQARDLAARIPNTTGLSSVEKGADIAGFVKLQAVNQCVATLEQIAGLPRLHPFAAYMAIVQAVGNLAIFGEDRVVPTLPVYDHSNLARCFDTLLDTVQSLIPAEVGVPYDAVSFAKDPMREGFYLCDLPAEWPEAGPLFLGVELAKPAEEAIELVETGIKLLAEEDLDRVLQGVVPGIRLEHVRTPPLAFPKRPDLHFFRIEMEGSSRAGWLKIAEAGSAVLLTALGGLGAEFHLYVELRL